ncbi:hypothetical protein RRF57_009636 [Xylaria bambusicola]|uniref:Uncharacterized protein n=1 Tax=Xylaria bambusicola TaxID=326684 RepID=A0AAN7Z936_9PEZI
MNTIGGTPYAFRGQAAPVDDNEDNELNQETKTDTIDDHNSGRCGISGSKNGDTRSNDDLQRGS